MAQFGVADVVTISKLAWQVYQTFKYAPKDLKVLEKQVLAISNLLDQIADTFKALHLKPSQRQALRQLVTQCGEALREVETITTCYAPITSGGGAKRKTLRYHMESNNIKQVQQQLMDQVALLSNFNSTIAIWSLAGIGEKLNSLITTAPDNPATSGHDVRTLHEDDASWPRLHQELEDIGFASEVIARNRKYFVAWIAAAISEKDPPDKKSEPVWNSPIEEETRQCLFCRHNDHDAKACPQMEVFDTNRVPTAPLAIPEHDKVDINPSSPFDSYSQRPPTLRGSTRSDKRRTFSVTGRTFSLTDFGTDSNASVGVGPGCGPQVPLHRPPRRPSSVSTGSSSSRASGASSQHSSDTNDRARRPGLGARFSSRLSKFGSDSSNLELGF